MYCTCMRASVKIKLITIIQTLSLGLLRFSCLCSVLASMLTAGSRRGGDYGVWTEDGQHGFIHTQTTSINSLSSLAPRVLRRLNISIEKRTIPSSLMSTGFARQQKRKDSPPTLQHESKANLVFTGLIASVLSWQPSGHCAALWPTRAKFET